MNSKVFSIAIIILVILLIGFAVWQQVEIRGIKSTFIELAELESALALNGEMQQTTQNLMLMHWADSGSYLAMGDLEQAEESLNLCEEYRDELNTLQAQYDDVVTVKVALLEGK
jgi:predicted negative regulator of RcsB-dependent stress response